MLIFFEGLDKTGKTTLITGFNKRTNFEHVVFDRGPISSLVYNKLYDRKYYEYQYFDIIKCLNNSGVENCIVYCEASNEVINERLEEHGEVLDECLSDLNKVKKEFEYYINYCKCIFGTKVIKIDTSKLTIEECIGSILSYIGR